MIGKLKRKVFPSFVVATLGLNLFVPSIMQAQEVDKTASFADVGKHWAADQINGWVQKGFIKGYEDNSFKPNNQITRAEFMTIVNKSFGYSEEAAIDYSDVPANAWYRSEIQKAKAAGYISGYTDNTVRPSAPISRQEVAVIIAKIKDLDTTGNNDYILNTFKDRASIPTWSKNSVGAIVEKGYMRGYTDGTYQPQKSITRAEAVVTLDNVIESKPVQVKETVIDKAGTYGSATQGETISGNVVVKAPGVTLVNKVITGDLILSEGVAEGNVTLEKVTVKGKTMILGGGENSIHLRSSTLDSVVVNKKNGKVRVLTYGNTAVKETILQSGATLEENEGTGSGFQKVLIASDIAKDSQVNLTGTFDQVDVEGKDIEINVPEGSTIETLTVKGAVKVTGKGTIEMADIRVSGSNFEYAPKKHKLGSNITAIIAGKTVRGTGGGGGGGGGPTTPTEKSDIDKINDGEKVTKDVTITEGNKTYGHASKVATLEENLEVKADNIKLQNVTIKKDLTIHDKTATGGSLDDFTADNVTVNGNTNIGGGSPNTVKFNNSDLGSVAINKENVRLAVSGTSSITGLAVNKKSVVDLSGGTVGSLSINAAVTLQGSGGNITAIEVNSPVQITMFFPANAPVPKITINTTSGVTIKSNLDIPPMPGLTVEKIPQDRVNAILDAIAAIDEIPMLAELELKHKSIVETARSKVKAAIAKGASESDISNLGKLTDAEKELIRLENDTVAPTITKISFGNMIATEDKENRIFTANLRGIPNNYKTANITVSERSRLAFKIGESNFGEVGLVSGLNSVEVLDLSEIDVANVDTSKVNFTKLFDTMRDSNVNRKAIVDAVNLDAIFAELNKEQVRDAINIFAIIDFGSLPKIDSETMKKISDLILNSGSNIDYREVLRILEESNISKQTIFESVKFNTLFAQLQNASVNRTALLNAVNLETIFKEIDKVDGVGKTILGILDALDGDGNPDQLTIKATLADYAGNSTIYTIKINF